MRLRFAVGAAMNEVGSDGLHREIEAGAEDDRAVSEDGIKVTDKRIFTPEGDLKEEYRFLEDEARQRPAEPAEPPPGAAGTAAPEPGPPPLGEAERPGPREPGADQAERPPLEIPSPGPEGAAPSFYDLLAVLADPIPFYLGDAALPSGETSEDLHLARLYIDLLDILRQKTAGNLTVQEANALEDLLYRLRLRYVQKRG